MRVVTGLLLVVLAGTVAAAADPKAPAETKCGDRTLAACTKARVQALHRLSRELKQAAATAPAKTPANPRSVEQLSGYDRWLTEQSGKASALAARGESALSATQQMQETQMSFNLQYLQLQSQMQSENRSYTAISNIMKTKHDTVKNSISNIR